MMRRKKPFFFRGSPATSEAPGKSGSTGRASRPFFRAHDIGLAYYISDTVYIMEHGKFVESGKADKVILHPQAAYTKRLISDVPKIHKEWDLSTVDLKSE